jgi:predicted RNA-binding Zn-ribbon protein involved in translation (DUF1610 family)
MSRSPVVPSDVVLAAKSFSDILQYLYRNRYAYCYTDLVHNHIVKDVDYVKEMTEVGIGSVQYVMIEMRRILLLQQCKDEVVELFRTKATRVDRDICTRCDIYYHYDQVNGANVCPQCGVTIQRHGVEQVIGTVAYARYNCNPIHLYAPREHFYQSLLDVTCAGRRNIPHTVMKYCRCVLGRGMHVTNAEVFRILQVAGYTRYYACKYEIAARLRGKPEIVLTSRETEMVRAHYRRYSKHMAAFQREYNLGAKNKRGQRRVYWPVRFIISEMLKLIDRDDMASHLRGVEASKRAGGYIRHWCRLREWVDHAEPMSSTVPEKHELIRLKRSCRDDTRTQKKRKLLRPSSG